jgi:hypothetical protein
METLHIAIALYIISLASIFIGASTAKADEPKIVQDYVQCTYVPKPSDMVFYQCADLVGKVQIKLSICGQAYTIDVTCPTVSAESNK